MIKKVIIIFASAWLCNLSVTASSIKQGGSSSIHKDYFTSYATEETSKIFKNKNISINQVLNSSLKRWYDGHLAEAVRKLEYICYTNGSNYVELSEFRTVVADEMQRCIDVIESAVLKADISKELNSKICDLFHKRGITKSDKVFKDNEKKYNSQLKIANDYLNSVMANDNRDFVTKQELEYAVTVNFSELVIQEKKEKTLDSVYKSQGTLINNDNLDKQVMLIADSILRDRVGYSQDTLPAWMISYYSDALQAVCEECRKALNTYNKSWLISSDVKKIVQRNLEEFFRVTEFHKKIKFDDAKFNKEKCDLCSRGFSSGQTVGFLDCGHFFHENCIRESLKHIPDECPCCREYTNGIDHIVSVSR